MNASSARTANKTIIALYIVFTVILGWILTAPVTYAYANGRMAGGNTQTFKTNKKKDITPSSHSYKILSEQDLLYVEALGTKKRFNGSALGIDMWQGSSYDRIIDLLEELPVADAPAPLYDLQAYILQGKADTRLLKRGRHGYKYENGGPDIFTLRVEKLDEMGAFEDAVELYSKSTLPPYNDRLARAAILAMLHARKTGQACLETQMLEPKNKESNDQFWKKLDLFCAHTLSLRLPRNHNLEGIVSELSKNDDYSYSPETIEELLSLEEIEKAMLFNRNIIDYSRMSAIDYPENISLRDLALLMDDVNVPPEMRIALFDAAISKGLKDKDDLAGFYESIELPLKLQTVQIEALDKTLESIPDWKKLPFLYRLLKNIEKSSSRTKILETALQQTVSPPYTSLFPFAEEVKDIDIANLSDESLEQLFPILIKNLSEEEINEINEKNFASQQDKKRGLFSCKNIKTEEKTTDTAEKNTDVKQQETIENKELYDKAECPSILKLDKYTKLHNIGPGKSYEKQHRLTFDDDYVMPFVDFIDRLDEAEKNNRHAEVVLLSMLVFQNKEGQEIPLALVERVTDALKTVGLIEVSRALLLNAMAGY